MMKVLPNELPPNPDIEKVKKEEYIFNKNEELITPVDSSIETNEIDSISPTDSIAKDSQKSSNFSEPFMEIISSIVDTTVGSNVENNPMPTTTEGVQMIIVERKDLEKTVTNQSTASTDDDDKSDDLGAKDVTVFSTNDIDLHETNEKLLNLSNGGILRGSVLETFHFDDDDEKKNDNDSDEDYGGDPLFTPRTPRPTTYLSRQHTMASSTLLHGFISNPGYPSFYIGKTSDCKWKLKLNEGQKISLTILDLHLRSELRLFDNEGGKFVGKFVEGWIDGLD
jgi:hypothetical protein